VLVNRNKTTGFAVIAALALLAGVAVAAAPECEGYRLKGIQPGMTLDDVRELHPDAKLVRKRHFLPQELKGRAWVIKRNYTKKHADNALYALLSVDGQRVASVETAYTGYGGMSNPVARKIDDEALLELFTDVLGDPASANPFSESFSHSVILLPDVNATTKGLVYEWESVECGLALTLRLGHSTNDVGNTLGAATRSVTPIQSALLTSIAERDRVRTAKKSEVQR